VCEELFNVFAVLGAEGNGMDTGVGLKAVGGLWHTFWVSYICILMWNKTFNM
jgi:hypothetical protein